MRLAILDEVRLIDNHALEPESLQPADVAVENVIVDDDDICISIQIFPGAVDDSCCLVWSPEFDFARPVHLHDVRNDDKQRVGVADRGGEQRLGGLAQARLIGQKVAAVAISRARDEGSLVVEQRKPGGNRSVGR